MRLHPIAAIVLIAVMTSTSASALGGKLGVQVAGIQNSLSGELPEDGKWKGSSSLGFGLAAELNLASDIALSFQPGYMPRRCRQDFEERGEVVHHYDYAIDYVALPLLVRVTGDPIGTRGFVTAGLELNVLLDASIDVGEGDQDITDAYRSSTLGALFGAGVMVPLGRNFLTVELRYSQGLNDIVERDGGDPQPGLNSPSVKYRGLSLQAGFLFTLGGD